MRARSHSEAGTLGVPPQVESKGKTLGCYVRASPLAFWASGLRSCEPVRILDIEAALYKCTVSVNSSRGGGAL